MNFTYVNQKIDEGLECSICLDILVNPIQETSCGQMFCRDCINRVKKIKPICPLCNCKIVEGTVPKLITNKLNEIKVICNICNDGEPIKRSEYKQHFSSGNCKTEVCKQCNGKFRKSEYPNPHLDKHCKLSIIKCSGSKVNCPFESTREQVLNHQTTCSYISLESILIDFITTQEKQSNHIIKLQDQINDQQQKQQQQPKQQKESQQSLNELSEQIKILKQKHQKSNDQKDQQLAELRNIIKTLKQEKESQSTNLRTEIKLLKKQQNNLIEERNIIMTDLKEQMESILPGMIENEHLKITELENQLEQERNDHKQLKDTQMLIIESNKQLQERKDKQIERMQQRIFQLKQNSSKILYDEYNNNLKKLKEQETEIEDFKSKEKLNDILIYILFISLLISIFGWLLILKLIVIAITAKLLIDKINIFWGVIISTFLIWWIW